MAAARPFQVLSAAVEQLQQPPQLLHACPNMSNSALHAEHSGHIHVDHSALCAPWDHSALAQPLPFLSQSAASAMLNSADSVADADAIMQPSEPAFITNIRNHLTSQSHALLQVLVCLSQAIPWIREKHVDRCSSVQSAFKILFTEYLSCSDVGTVRYWTKIYQKTHHALSTPGDCDFWITRQAALVTLPILSYLKVLHSFHGFQRVTIDKFDKFIVIDELISAVSKNEIKSIEEEAASWLDTYRELQLHSTALCRLSGLAD